MAIHFNNFIRKYIHTPDAFSFNFLCLLIWSSAQVSVTVQAHATGDIRTFQLTTTDNTNIAILRNVTAAATLVLDYHRILKYEMFVNINFVYIDNIASTWISYHSRSLREIIDEPQQVSWWVKIYL
jgi:hypothetical protein